MARYIDAEEFSKNLSLRVYMEDDNFFTEEVVKAMDTVKRAESETETADVQPVVHAHWVVCPSGDVYCSNCEWSPEKGYTVADLQLTDVYYCPHCGARMDEEAEDE